MVGIEAHLDELHLFLSPFVREKSACVREREREYNVFVFVFVLVMFKCVWWVGVGDC